MLMMEFYCTWSLLRLCIFTRFILNNVHVVDSSQYAGIVIMQGDESVVIFENASIGILPNCAKLCEREDCLSFAYNHVSTSCKTFSNELLDGWNGVAGNLCYTKILPVSALDPFLSKTVEMYNVATNLTMVIGGLSLFVVQPTSDARTDYFIKSEDGGTGAFMDKTKNYLIHMFDVVYSDHYWWIRQNKDGSFTFKSRLAERCLGMIPNSSIITARECSPYSGPDAELFSWKLHVVVV